MLVVVDANTVFSALLSKGRTFDVFLAPHARDVQYFALALSFNAAIWSNEKAFKKQSKVKVFSTSELISFLSEI